MTDSVLLLTDIVDSTQRTEHLGDAAMAELWTRHDRLARDLLAHHDGREIERTDGFLLLFPTVAVAVAYAAAYHRAIRPLDLRARVGVHKGPLALRENSAADIARGARPLEVEGVAKPVATRVTGLAQGGQTLLTAEAHAALGETGLRIVSQGHWRLKGVTAAVEIFEVGQIDSSFTPPPDSEKAYRVVREGHRWMPVEEGRHSLPRERDAFVGREADLQLLTRRLEEECGLVTVLGIGGTGKTRLAIHHAWTWLGDWPGGTWFCDLSEARDVDGIATAVARALDVPLGKDDPVVQLGHAIAGRGRCLFLLDNFEQVARYAPDTLGKWLDRAREAQFVVTTREVLGLPGETTVALAPLGVPDGVGLFVARAAQAKQGYTLSDADRPHVAALVKLLDGLPLAIELAAARVRVLAPSALLQRMSQRFQLLASSGGRHTRQATLRATLDWSWDLLAPDEQEALAQLSVFEGGFPLAAAEEVLALHELWPADAVQALVDKSLVRRVEDDRLDLLVSVQEYAAEKLETRGGRADAEARHGAYFATFGTEDALASLHVHGGTERRRALGYELDNLVAACRRAVTGGDAEVATATLCAASEVLKLRGPLRLEVDLASDVRERAALGLRQRARVEGMLGCALVLSARDHRAGAHLEAALALWREAGDRHGEATARRDLGHLQWKQGEFEPALENFEASLLVFLELGDRRMEAVVRVDLALVADAQGRLDEAGGYGAGALAIYGAIGDAHGEGVVRNELGVVALHQGRLPAAREHFEAALALYRATRSKLWEAMALNNLGDVLATRGSPDEARRHFEAALALHREVGNARSEGISLVNLGILNLEQGRWGDAQAYLDAALAVHRTLGNRRVEGLTLAALGRLCLEQGRHAEARAHTTAGEALLRAVGAIVDLGALLCVRARLEHAEGHLETARSTLAEATRVAASFGAGPESGLGQDLARVRALLEAP